MNTENAQACRCETCNRRAHELSEAQALLEEQALESVRAKSDVGQKLVDETVDGMRSLADLVLSLHELGFRPEEAQDFVEAAKRRIEIRQAKARAIPQASGSSSPLAPLDSSRQPEPERSATLPVQSPDPRPSSHVQAIESAAWAALLNQVDPSRKDAKADTIRIACDLIRIPESKDTESMAILASLLAIAPHLACFQDEASDDPHLAKT